jgi:hypothetical protein
MLLMARDMLDSRLPKDALVCLPYCWHTVPNTTGMILLNRLYRPVSVTAGEYVDYADFPELMVPRYMIHDELYLPAEVPSHTPNDMALHTMFCNPGSDPRRWFFNDCTDPRKGKKQRQRLAGVIRANLNALEELQ